VNIEANSGHGNAGDFECLRWPGASPEGSQILVESDRSGRPIQWGRVYIRDSRAHILKIKPVGRDGRFNIAYLDARLDYEIYAEQDYLISEKVLLSGSQSNAKVVITLKLRNK
jgi:hypothetical protein